jgi:crossover junction endodeoxyribonuclease RusA
LKIVLAFPDKKLSPNARLHWRAKSDAVRRARWDASYAVLEAAGGSLSAIRASLGAEGRIPLQFRFYPPDRRARDDDNLMASMKAARDGIADALGVNDRRFKSSYEFEEPDGEGRVEVEILAPEEGRAAA